MRLWFCFLLLAASESAHAARAARHGAEKSTAVVLGTESAPLPGTCVSPQSGVKICSVLPDGQGVFDVQSSWPGLLHVRFQEKIESFIEPDPKFFQSDKREQTVTIIPIARHLPAHAWQATIGSQHLTVTLNIVPTKTRGDAQVTILDPRHAERALEKAATDARVSAEARALGDEKLLWALTETDLTLRKPRGRTIARSRDLVVLRATRVVELGGKSFLSFSIENESAEPFEPGPVRLLSGKKEIPTQLRLAHAPILPKEEVRGVLALSSPLRRREVALIVERVGGARAVTLEKLEMP